MLVSRRHFFFGSLALPAFAGKVPLVRPNLLLILVDDLPAWALGCYGNKEIQTPNIDRLAQTGTRFLNHFAATPAPGPGRGTFLTGRTSMQLGAAGAPSAADTGLDKLLGDAGYAVHSAQGAEGAKFLDQQSPGKPFFLTANFSNLHPPYDGVAQKYRDLYAKEPFNGYRTEALRPDAQAGKEMLSDIIGNLRKCAAAITALDDEVAALLTKLYQKQLIDGTLIVFAGTSGALLGRHGLWGSGDASNPPNMYDEVVATPMLWSWPGRVPAQATQVELVSSYDFVPTICEAAFVAPPERNLCGRSYLLFATGKPLPKKQKWRTAVCANYRNTDMARIARYKLVLRDGGKGPNELYDLVADPRETANQADNDAFATIRSSLAGEISKWKGQYSS